MLSDVESALVHEKAVIFRAAVQVNDYLPLSRRDIVAFEGPTLAWARALAQAQLTLRDLSLVETHDCFTTAELIACRVMNTRTLPSLSDAPLTGRPLSEGPLPQHSHQQVYGAYRVFRGGSWSDPPTACRASCRRKSHPNFQIDDLGFRLARSLDSQGA